MNKADVFITHCGMNSVSESLYFGVPLVMLPQTNEQKGVCQRVLQLGAGAFLNKHDITSIRSVVVEVMNNEKYKYNANVISNSFKKCSGAKGAVDKIIEVCIDKNTTV